LYAEAGCHIRRYAKNSATNATTIKIGRDHSASVIRYKIRALLRPIVNNKNGPRQQIEARTAATPPMHNKTRPLFKSGELSSVRVVLFMGAWLELTPL